MKYIFACILISLSIGCANKVKLDETKARFTTEPGQNKSLSATVSWLKNKGNAIDLYLTLENSYDKSVVIPKESYQIHVAGQYGKLKRVDFNEVLPAKSSETGILVFTFGNEVPASGSFVVTIAPIKWTEGNQDKKIPPLKFELPLYILQ